MERFPDPEVAAPVAEPLSDDDSGGLTGLTRREEEHLYLQLQRFSFCLDRYAARRAETPPSPET